MCSVLLTLSLCWFLCPLHIRKGSVFFGAQAAQDQLEAARGLEWKIGERHDTRTTRARVVTLGLSQILLVVELQLVLSCFVSTDERC